MKFKLSKDQAEKLGLMEGQEIAIIEEEVIEEEVIEEDVPNVTKHLKAINETVVVDPITGYSLEFDAIGMIMVDTKTDKTVGLIEYNNLKLK